MKHVIVLVMAVLSIPAFAQINYCVINDKKVLTDRACPQGVQLKRRSTARQRYEEQQNAAIARDRFLREQQAQAAKQSPRHTNQRSASQSLPQDNRDRHLCSVAQRNYGVRSTIKNSRRIEVTDQKSRQQIITYCGYDPEAGKPAIQQKPEPEKPKRKSPTIITDCNPDFCYDNKGGVYHRNGDGFLIKPGGGTCVIAGNVCH